MLKKKDVKVTFRFMLTLVLVTVLMLNIAMPVQAATKSSDVVLKLKSAVGSSNYPFSSLNSVKSSRRVFGVQVSYLDNYAAYQKTTGTGSNKTEYILFVGKATSKSNAKKAKTALKKYISSESKSMNSYLSKTGKKVFKNAQISYSGTWVWCVMLKSSTVNKKAVKAIKKAI